MEAVFSSYQSTFKRYPFEDKVIPLIYKFISIIFATERIPTSQLTLEKYQDAVYPKLGITRYSSVEFFQKKLAIAEQYARILKNRTTNTELIKVVKEVFKKHLMDQGALESTGIALEIEDVNYYAKLTDGNICILEGKGKKLGGGAHGEVWRVYEIATRQMLALKYANSSDPDSDGYMECEINNLKKIHKRNNDRTVPLEGLQEPFLAEFDLPNLFGYAGPQYDMDLATFIASNRTNDERLLLCQKLMKVFENIDRLGLWHGDYKLDNIMLKNGQPIVIDWAGAVFLDEAATKFKKPRCTTPCYLNRLDKEKLERLLKEKNSTTRNDFVQTAKSLELFSIATVLYLILTSEFPFNDTPFAETEKGIHNTGLARLKTYSDKIMEVMKAMLAHDPEDRLSSPLAFSVWESIT